MSQFNYIKNCSLYSSKYIKSIIFNTTKSKKYETIIPFDNKVTETDAILAVEKYLSQKITKDYTDFREEIFNDNLKYRGDLLGDCINLDKIRKIKNDQIKLEVY